MDGRGDKIGTDRKGQKKRIGQSEVLHRAMYPNAHGNGIKKKKKNSSESWYKRQTTFTCINLSVVPIRRKGIWASSGRRHTRL